MTTSVYETKHVDKIVKLGLFGGGNIAILNAQITSWVCYCLKKNGHRTFMSD